MKYEENNRMSPASDHVIVDFAEISCWSFPPAVSHITPPQIRIMNAIRPPRPKDTEIRLVTISASRQRGGGGGGGVGGVLNGVEKTFFSGVKRDPYFFHTQKISIPKKTKLIFFTPQKNFQI